MTDVLVIGAGPAGLTAAIYAARAGISVVVFDKNMYGGQTALTGEVDNYPGMQGMSGVDFATALYEHATKQGATVRFEEITAVQLSGDVKKLTTTEGVYEARAVVLASGAARRRLGVPGEDAFIGKGVSFCATCDAAFFRGKEVAIVGGGDTALDDALFLSNHCKKVYLIHRRDQLRGEKRKQDAVFARENIEVLFSTTVQRIEGRELLDGVLLNTPQGERQLPVNGVFVAVGLTPETDLYAGQLQLDARGYVDAGEDCHTELPGVFVAGDLRRKPLRQILTAAADGAVAAVAAAEYCNASEEGMCSMVGSAPREEEDS